MREELIGREETARILGVSLNMVDIYRARGDLKTVPTPHYGIYFRRSEVQAYKRLRAARLRKKQKKSQMKATGQTKVSESEPPNN